MHSERNNKYNSWLSSLCIWSFGHVSITVYRVHKSLDQRSHVLCTVTYVIKMCNPVRWRWPTAAAHDATPRATATSLIAVDSTWREPQQTSKAVFLFCVQHSFCYLVFAAVWMALFLACFNGVNVWHSRKGYWREQSTVRYQVTWPFLFCCS